MLVLSATVSSLYAQNGMHFVYAITSPAAKGNSTMNAYVLPSIGYRAEMEMVIPQIPKPIKITSIFQNRKPNLCIQIDEEKKIYTEAVLEKSNAQKNEKASIQIIGKEKLNGYNCVHSQVKQGKILYDIWTTKEIADYDELTKYIQSQQHSDFQDIWTQLKANNADGFMVKMQSNATAGITMELIKAEKRNVLATLFSIPSDYKKVDKATFIQQRMGAMIPQRH